MRRAQMAVLSIASFRAALLQSSAVEGMAEAVAMKLKGYDLGEIAEE